MDFDRLPFIVIWELTRACSLACLHCRAAAIPRRDPQELITSEGLDLIAAGTERGIRVALTPSGTAAAGREKILRLKAAGLARLAVSLDGSTAEVHDAFRGVRGSFDWTLRILEYAREAELPIQINTTVTRHIRYFRVSSAAWFRPHESRGVA